MSEEEFCTRFEAYMLSVAGPTFLDGSSVAEYARDAGPTYFEDESQREMGPEECADADMSYWGEE